MSLKTARIRRRATIAVASALSLPFALDHARPSFFALPLGYQRTLIRGKLRELNVRRDIARIVAKRWTPSVVLSDAGKEET